MFGSRGLYFQGICQPKREPTKSGTRTADLLITKDDHLRRCRGVLGDANAAYLSRFLQLRFAECCTVLRLPVVSEWYQQAVDYASLARPGGSREILACGRYRFVQFVLRGGWDGEVLVEDVVGVVPRLELAEPGERVAGEGVVQALGARVGLEAEVEAVEVWAQLVPVAEEVVFS